MAEPTAASAHTSVEPDPVRRLFGGRAGAPPDKTNIATDKFLSLIIFSGGYS